MHNFRINGISGSSGNIRNNDTILPKELIRQGALSYIRFSDKRNL